MNAAFDARPAAYAYAVAFRKLRELPGFSALNVLRAESGVILKTWAGRTKVTTKQHANLRARYRAGKRAFGYTNIGNNPFGISVNTGMRDGFPGEVWHRFGSKRFRQVGVIHQSGNFTASWYHWKAETWAKIQEGTQIYGQKLREQLSGAERSIGFSRQSVIQIADQLGIDLGRVKGGGTLSAAGIAKARAAIASNGKAYSNGSGSQGGDEVRAHVEMISRLPYGSKIGMDRTLAGILAGRAKYIERSYAEGAFSSMKKVSAAFPNIFNTAGLS